MKKALLASTFLAIVAGTTPALASDYKIIDTSSIDRKTCEVRGYGPWFDKVPFAKYDKYVKGYDNSHFKSTSAFIKENMKFLNHALIGKTSDRHDQQFKARIMQLVKSKKFTRLDWEEKGGSSPSFVTTILVKNLSYSVEYLVSKNLITDKDMKQIDKYMSRLIRNLEMVSEGRYQSVRGTVAIDHQFSAGTAMLMWGAVSHNDDLFTKGKERFFKVLKRLDRHFYFAKDLRHNNEAVHNMTHGAHILKLNGIDVMSMEFKTGSVAEQIQLHAKKVVENGSKKIKTSGDRTSKARSILRKEGYGTHVAWVPIYFTLGNDAEVQNLHEVVSEEWANSRYYTQLFGVDPGCYWGANDSYHYRGDR